MKKVKAGKSKIHGNGLIADEPIRRGDVIELVHTIREIEPGVKKTTPTLLGRNYNHSEEPNSMNVIDGDNRYLVALKEIEVGGEITTDYRNNPDLEQPDSFTSNDNYVSFDYDDTLTTPEGFKLAKQMVKDGNNLYVITARDKMSPQMIERAEAAGIPKENIILAGSDEQKVKIVKDNNISKHIDNKESVIKALGKTGELFNPGKYPNLKADFIEMDLSDEDLNQLKKGGFIIDQYPDGGIVEYNGYRYRKDNSGNWIFADSGAPVTDKMVIYKLPYEGKPVGSPVVQTAPKPKPISTVTKQQQLETIKNSPVIADQRKANELQDAIRNENVYFPKGEPAEDEPGGVEGAINSALGYPMAKAALSSEFASNEGQIDNYRHANAGRYTAEAIKNMTGNIPYLSDAAAIIGANALGLGHEVGSFFTNSDDTRPWTSKLKESGEDMYNNFIGTTIGVSDMPSVEKTDKLLNLSYTNQLPDGYVKDPRAPKNVPNNMYFKHGPNDPGKYKPRYPDGGQTRPVQGMAKPLAPLAIRQEQVKVLKNSPKVADQKKYKAVQDEVKAKAAIQKASKQLDELQKDALPQHEQPLVAQDWIWTLPMMGGSAMKSAGTAIADGMGAVGTKVMPYITGALETSIPGMASIPGATVGNAIASGFATDAIVNRLPEGVTQLNNGQYIDATGNILTGVLDVAGAGMMSPMYQGAKSTASELARFFEGVPKELPGSPNSKFFNTLSNSEIPQINPQTGLLQVNNTTSLSSVLPRTFKETYIPDFKSAEGLSEDAIPYLLPQQELMTRAPWRYLSKDQEIMNSFKSGMRAQERPVEIPKEFNTQEDIMARALGKPLPERASLESLKPKIYYDIDGNVIDDPLKSGFDGNFLTRPLTPFTKNELTTLPNKNLKYRKIGNKAGLQDLINKGGAQAPAPMRMKSGLTADTPFFGMGKKPSEDYKGIFAVELKPDNSKYNWSSRVAGTDNYGVAPFDKVTGRSIKNIPLEDLNVYRKKFLSNNYKKLDPNNLEAGLKYAQAQVLAEQAYKWGIRGVTADQIFNDGEYRKQLQEVISNKLIDNKKEGGSLNYMVKELTQEEIEEYRKGGWIVEDY